MSKEQIKIICDDARALTDNDNKMIRCHINIKHFDWLIDRARELERLKDAFDDLDSDYIDLSEQNKRYRTALKEIKKLWERSTDATDDTNLAWKMSCEAHKALESGNGDN